MKRLFVDLHLRINPMQIQASEHMLTKAANLAYRQIGISINLQSNGETNFVQLKESAAKIGLDLVSRVDFQPKNEEDLTRFLRKFRRRFEVICIQCTSKEVARQAAKDRRVDLLSFPNFDYRKRFFDLAEAELASNCLAALEIDFRPLLFLAGPYRTRFLSTLRREVAIALRFNVPIVLSSGVGEEKFLRSPRDSASLGFLFGLGEEESLDAVSVNPAGIVCRNREKLDSSFVAPGIKVIKQGGRP
jgi:RNase P/RNase MRP subunit p30